MVPVKWGCRGVWSVLSIRGVQGVYGMKGVNREGTPTWKYLPMKLCVPPTIIVGG